MNDEVFEIIIHSGRMIAFVIKYKHARKLLPPEYEFVTYFDIPDGNIDRVKKYYPNAKITNWFYASNKQKEPILEHSIMNSDNL